MFGLPPQLLLPSALAAIFDLSSSIFIVIYIGLCAYIAAQTIGNELE
jgi:hypothetical protein